MELGHYHAARYRGGAETNLDKALATIAQHRKENPQ